MAVGGAGICIADLWVADFAFVGSGDADTDTDPLQHPAAIGNAKPYPYRYPIAKPYPY